MIVRRCLGLVLLAALTGCGAPHSERGAVLQLVHLSPDSPDIELRLDGTLVLGLGAKGARGLSFKQASRELTVDSGTHTIAISRLGGSKLLQTTRSLAGGSQFSLALLGFLAPATGQPALSLNTIETRTLPSAAKTGIRFMNAGVGNATLDAVFDRTGGTVEPLATGLTFGQASNVTAGVHTLVSVAPGAGVVLVSTGGTELVRGSVTLLAGERRRFAAVGTLASAELVSWVGP